MKTVRLILLLSISIVLYLASAYPVSASVDCNVTISPHQIDPHSENNTYTATVTNWGNQVIEYVYIGKPSNNYTITGHSISGWTVNQTADSITAIHGSLEPSDESAFVYSVSAGDAADQDDWVVYTSDSADGSGQIFCSGDLSSTIGNPPDTTPPVIVSVAASEISNTSATITWTTNELSTSVLQYGTDESYGTTKTNASYSTLHSFTITGLVANTEYHVKAMSADSSDNEATSGDEVFMTSQSSATTTPSYTPTPTSGSSTTTTSVPTPTPTPIPDREKPVVTLNTLTVAVSSTTPPLRVTAIDNRGITSLEYSVDKGMRWKPINGWVSQTGRTLVSYEFIPAGTTEGLNVIIVRAKDASGNIGVSQNIRFTLDTQGPKISTNTSFERPFSSSPTIRGTALDQGGESSIKYSIDGGQSWLPVDVTSFSSPYTTGFEFTPPKLLDGNYPVRIAANDAFGQLAEISVGDLIIDRIAPKIGLGIYSIGSMLLNPNESGSIDVVEKMPVKLTLSVIGGATKVVITTRHIYDKQNSSPIQLLFDRSTGLWSGATTFTRAGSYEVDITAQDGAQRVEKRTIGLFRVHALGKVISDNNLSRMTQLTVYERDAETQEYRPWDGTPYGILNPQQTDANDTYTLVLPKGEYFIEFTGNHLQTTRTKLFTVSSLSFITDTFFPESRRTIDLRIFTFPMPNIPWLYPLIDPPAINNSQSETISDSANFSWKEIYNSLKLIYPSIEDKPTTLILVPSWHPDIVSIMNSVTRISKNSDQTIIVMPQESASTIELFRIRGRYPFMMVPDPDGTIIPILHAHMVPLRIRFFKEAGEMKIEMDSITKSSGIE